MDCTYVTALHHQVLFSLLLPLPSPTRPPGGSQRGSKCSSTNAQIPKHKYRNTQIHKYSNTNYKYKPLPAPTRPPGGSHRGSKCSSTNTQIPKYTNTQIHKYQNTIYNYKPTRPPGGSECKLQKPIILRNRFGVFDNVGSRVFVSFCKKNVLSLFQQWLLKLLFNISYPAVLDETKQFE